MENRSFDLTILSAEDLKRVPRFGKMNTYAIAWILPYDRKATPLDTNGTKPVWNYKLSFTAPEAAFQPPQARLTIEIYSRGTFGKKFVGAVFVPLTDILKATQEERLTYQVKRRSGHTRGYLNISARIGDKTTVDTSRTQETGSSSNPPVMAYPASGYSYGNMQQGAYPPQYESQGYQPQYYSSAYPSQGYQQQYYPPVQQPGRRPGFGGLGGGMGLGTGLLTGALGGLLIGDLIGSEMNGGFGGGFGGFDGGGFGF